MNFSLAPFPSEQQEFIIPNLFIHLSTKFISRDAENRQAHFESLRGA
jgi:hypothetical protein